jgi:hypothetical protein
VVLAPLLTLVLVILRGQPNLTTDVLAFLVAVIAVAPPQNRLRTSAGLGPGPRAGVVARDSTDANTPTPKAQFPV